LHLTDTPALEADGLTHLFGQVFTLADFLTPAVIKTVTGLLREWVDDELTAKS
jgi:phage-related holin